MRYAGPAQLPFPTALHLNPTACCPLPPIRCAAAGASAASLASTPGSAAAAAFDAGSGPAAGASAHTSVSGGGGGGATTPDLGTSAGSFGSHGLKPTAREFVPGRSAGDSTPPAGAAGTAGPAGGAAAAAQRSMSGFGVEAGSGGSGLAAGLKPTASEFRPGQSGLSSTLK